MADAHPSGWPRRAATTTTGGGGSRRPEARRRARSSRPGRGSRSAMPPPSTPIASDSRGCSPTCPGTGRACSSTTSRPDPRRVRLRQRPVPLGPRLRLAPTAPRTPGGRRRGEDRRRGSRAPSRQSGRPRLGHRMRGGRTCRMRRRDRPCGGVRAPGDVGPATTHWNPLVKATDGPIAVALGPGHSAAIRSVGRGRRWPSSSSRPSGGPPDPGPADRRRPGVGRPAADVRRRSRSGSSRRPGAGSGRSTRSIRPGSRGRRPSKGRP